MAAALIAWTVLSVPSALVLARMTRRFLAAGDHRR